LPLKRGFVEAVGVADVEGELDPVERDPDARHPRRWVAVQLQGKAGVVGGDEIIRYGELHFDVLKRIAVVDKDGVGAPRQNLHDLLPSGSDLISCSYI
jgi:hypothetical protein